MMLQCCFSMQKSFGNSDSIEDEERMGSVRLFDYNDSFIDLTLFDRIKLNHLEPHCIHFGNVRAKIDHFFTVNLFSFFFRSFIHFVLFCYLYSMQCYLDFSSFKPLRVAWSLAISGCSDMRN